MKDRLGNTLNIGDKCVCYSNMGVGSSTSKLVQYVGVIEGSTRCYIKVKCTECEYKHQEGYQFHVNPTNVFKIKED